MTIDKANKLLSVITSTITEDDDSFTIEDENLQVFKETLLTAIDTMRKYQKIKEIVSNNDLEWGNTSVRAGALLEVKKVIENGNDK